MPFVLKTDSVLEVQDQGVYDVVRIGLELDVLRVSEELDLSTVVLRVY